MFKILLENWHFYYIECIILILLNKEEKTADIKTFLSGTSDYYIPRSIKYQTQEYLVTSILPYSSGYKLKSIQFAPECHWKKITIPSSLTAIPIGAFGDCYTLEQIMFVFPSSVTSIGDFALADCRSLKQISLPSSVTFLGVSVFDWCKSLNHLIIPSSVDRSNFGFIYRIKITPF